MSDYLRDDARKLSPATLANQLRTLALIPGSFSPASATVLLQEAASRIDPGPSDPSPSDIAYDDMTRAWRNEDYPLAWSLADALLQYLANGGQPLTGGRDMYYSRRVHAYYLAPGDPLVMPAPSRLGSWLAESERVVSAAGADLDSGHLLELLEALSSAVRDRMSPRTP